jgi:cell division septum initiation protein DivIVA
MRPREGEDVMAIEHSQPGPHDAGGGNLFQTVMLGYHKHQVEDQVTRLQERIFALEAELEAARRSASATSADPVARQRQSRPRHEGVSLRMAQILQLADEEAKQARVEAAEQAAAVLERAQTEARELLEAARSTAEEVLRGVMRRSEEELAAARAEASRLVAAAREQAQAILPDQDQPSHPTSARADVP